MLVELLSEKQDGTFLVRNSSQMGNFAFSFVSNKEIRHMRVKRISLNQFQVDNGEITQAPSLLHFIKTLTSKLSLASPCPGSRYSQNFLDSEKEIPFGNRN